MVSLVSTFYSGPHWQMRHVFRYYSTCTNSSYFFPCTAAWLVLHGTSSETSSKSLLTSYSATTNFRQLIETDSTIEFMSGWRLCSINEIASAENCIPKLLNRGPALVPARSNSVSCSTVLDCACWRKAKHWKTFNNYCSKTTRYIAVCYCLS